MTPEFRAQCADKVTNQRFIRFTEQNYVICTVTTVNGSVVVGTGITEVEAHRMCMQRFHELEHYLAKEREYENGLGILGVRFKSDPPYEVPADTE